MGLAQPGWCRPDDPRDAARERRVDGREVPGRAVVGSTALNDETDAAVPPPSEEAPLLPRRHPSTIGGAFYILILVATATAVGTVYFSHDWRLGVRILASALAGAAGLRLVLPRRDAGMLAVRHRLVDVLLLGGVSVVLFALATSIPDQPV